MNQQLRNISWSIVPVLYGKWQIHCPFCGCKNITIKPESKSPGNQAFSMIIGYME